MSVSAGVRGERIHRDALPGDPLAFTPRPDFPARDDRLGEPQDCRALGGSPGDPGVARVDAPARRGRHRHPAAGCVRDGVHRQLGPEAGAQPQRRLGVEQTWPAARVQVDATAFFNRFDDLIVVGRAVRLRAVSRWRTDNISNARARGLEVSAAWRPAVGVRPARPPTRSRRRRFSPWTTRRRRRRPISRRRSLCCAGRGTRAAVDAIVSRHAMVGVRAAADARRDAGRRAGVRTDRRALRECRLRRHQPRRRRGASCRGCRCRRAMLNLFDAALRGGARLPEPRAGPSTLESALLQADNVSFRYHAGHAARRRRRDGRPSGRATSSAFSVRTARARRRCCGC